MKYKEFWKENKKGYLIASSIIAFLGLMMYFMRISSNPFETINTATSLIIISFSFAGCFTMMSGMYLFLMGEK